MAERIYNAVVITRPTYIEDALKKLHFSACDRLGSAAGSWSVNLDRAAKMDFLLVRDEIRFIHIGRILGVEPVPYSSVSENPEIEGRSRFIISTQVPGMIEAQLIGHEVHDPRLFGRNPVHYAEIVVDPVEETVVVRVPDYKVGG